MGLAKVNYEYHSRTCTSRWGLLNRDLKWISTAIIPLLAYIITVKPHPQYNQIRQSDYFDENAMDSLIFAKIFTTRK